MPKRIPVKVTMFKDGKFYKEFKSIYAVCRFTHYDYRKVRDMINNGKEDHNGYSFDESL